MRPERERERPGDSPELRILHVEDDPNDAELIRLALESDGLSVSLQRVTTRDEMVAALVRGGFDLVLSDFALPGFNGLSALRIAREHAPALPFILVSGQIGEEAAVDGVRGGATDYVLKHRLSRLGPSVRRALAEAAERRRRELAEDALRQSEAQLRQSQKMEAVGRLAGGVAHDFNNLLTAILGYSQLVEERLEPGSDARRDVGEIVRAAERAASLTRQLLAFSRQQVMQPRTIDLNGVITELDRMLRRLIGDDIDLVTYPEASLGRVKADPGQVEQMLVNLAVNARDAMPHGGKITIETANVDFDVTRVGGSRQAPPGRYVMLAVSDTGFGMDPETASRVFEPFFTTKEPGQGTGLGLSMVHGIVHQSDGHIDIYSVPGRGTTFKIYLPRTSGELQPESAAEPAPPVPRGCETVLLIDDDSLVRGVVAATLCRNGYQVIEASNRDEASEACDRCEREQRTIDLLLSDVVMPGMSLPEFSERLRRRQPGMRLMFMSGYTDKAMLRHGMIDPDVPFLQKPFSTQVLLTKVREVLGGIVADGRVTVEGVMRATILVVDDDAHVRELVVRFLRREGYATVTASNGREALAIVSRQAPDLVLLDVEMPVMDGFETCRRLKEDARTALIPVTMLTGLHAPAERTRGIDAGADDFLGKPFDRATLRARLRTQLRLKRLTDQLEHTETVIFSMARWVEMKDQYTEGHLRRVAGYSEQIARACGLGGAELVHVRFAGILHDIGKIAVPDAIITKTGRLTSEEQEVLQRHPDSGAEIIAPMRFASAVAPLIRAHHERWDGRGYPRRLRGEDIPLGARIIAVVDAWDAMMTDRPYRNALGHEESSRRLRQGAGTQWDRRVIELFLELSSHGALAPIDLPGGEPMTV